MTLSLGVIETVVENLLTSLDITIFQLDNIVNHEVEEPDHNSNMELPLVSGNYIKIFNSNAINKFF